MNKRQREVIQHGLNSEEEVLEALKETYNKALEDVEKEIKLLTVDDAIQSKIYRKEYQEQLKQQISSVLDELNSGQFKTIDEYVKACYTDSFIGTMYDIAGQGVPLIIPIDQNQLIRAVSLDSKLSKSLYESLGENVDDLKKTITQEISRGIATASNWRDIARNISYNMMGDYSQTRGSMAYAYRIARTEGHRIQNEAALHAQKEAKKNGADVVKQWDATLDGATRPNHRLLDGQIRELDEMFSVPGMSADAPGCSGIAAEDINCRCTLLQRARWAVEDNETFTKWDGINEELLTLNSENYEKFKEAYQDMVDNNMSINKVTANLYNEAKKNEPGITSDLKMVVEGTHGTLEYGVGDGKTALDFRLKTEESTKRKVTSDFVAGKKLGDIEKETYDCVRYTDTISGHFLTADYNKVNELLEEKGYSIVRVKNTLWNENSPYRGLNTVVETRDGYKFELQFHTPESLKLKEINHVLYEKQRQDGISKEEYDALFEKMVENSKKLPVIEGAETIDSFNNLK